jgi:hypothetical protein
VIQELIFGFFFVAIAVAVLRYRLYELDRIINRTLVYGLLTALLGGTYAGLVLVLGQLLGQELSSLAVAGATLAAAALFQPARHSIQQAVGRRFDRRRYDAAQTVAAFSARLRDQVDLDTLSSALLAVVDERMQPTTASCGFGTLPPRVTATWQEQRLHPRISLASSVLDNQAA